MHAVIQIAPVTDSQQIAYSWGKLTWHASGSLGNSEDMTVGCCLLKPGESNPRHYHPNCSEILVVTQGRIRHTAADGGEADLGVGDTVTIPANVWHQASNIGSTEALLFIVFSSADRETVREALS